MKYSYLAAFLVCALSVGCQLRKNSSDAIHSSNNLTVEDFINEIRDEEPADLDGDGILWDQVADILANPELISTLDLCDPKVDENEDEVPDESYAVASRSTGRLAPLTLSSFVDEVKRLYPASEGVEELSFYEASLLLAYTTGWFYDANAALRTGSFQEWTKNYPWVRELLCMNRSLHKLYKLQSGSTPFQDPDMLYRGASLNADIIEKYKSASEASLENVRGLLIEKAFTSTSRDLNVALNFAAAPSAEEEGMGESSGGAESKVPVLFEISFEDEVIGADLTWVSAYGADTDDSVSGEREWLLPAFTAVAVVSVREDVDYNFTNSAGSNADIEVTVIKLKVLGKDDRIRLIKAIDF